MIRRSLALAGVLAIVAAQAALAAPVTVTLRVEGATTTIFEGPVTTDGKQIDKGDGPHPCDGTNLNANPTPGPTMTSALDDGSIAGGFTWDGTWFAGFEDFGIDRIGPDASSASQFWGYALNYAPTQVGGCQQRVAAGDEVLFGYDFFSKTHLLKLTAPQRAATGESFTVTVVDGKDGTPVAGASVGGALTGADGTATLAFESAGVQRLKADHPTSIRSNAAQVCVYVPGSGGCGTEPAPGTSPAPDAPQLPEGATLAVDRIAPRVFVSRPRSGARYRRPPRTLAGRVDEDRALHGVYLRLRRIDSEGCRWLSGRREVFTRAGTCASARYIRLGDRADWSYLLPSRLPRGRYVLDVKAIDRSLNRDVEQVRFRVV